MTMHKGLLLDFDGTVVQSLGILKKVYFDFLDQFDKKGSTNEFNILNGPPLPKIIEILKEEHNLPGTHETLLNNYHNLVDQLYINTKASPGINQLFTAAKQKNYRIGIVSSNIKKRIEDWLVKNKLQIFIDIIIDGTMVLNGKPHPEPFNLACQKLNLDKTQTIAVEDSKKGLESCISAELNCFAMDPEEQGNWPVNIAAIKDFHDLIHHL